MVLAYRGMPPSRDSEAIALYLFKRQIMDSIEVFIEKLERELDMIEPGSLTPDVNYRTIPNWSSMYALIIVALCETEYDVAVTGEDLRQCNTVSDLYQVVASRKK